MSAKGSRSTSRKSDKADKADKAVKTEASSGLPDHLEEMRSKVFVKSTYLDHANASEDPDAFRSLDFDNSFDIEEWKKQFSINIMEKTEEHIIFDVKGAGAPIANAIRRALISDVPTMAIEKVVLFQNTSLIQDEVLAHRIGLIPIHADPKMFSYVGDDGEATEENTTVMTIEVTCTMNPKATLSAPNSVMYNNSVVYSSALKWVPQGDQAEKFKADPIRPVHDDIVLAKLRPGQSIEAELHIIKGIGRDHAKWSPAATAFYRQMPDIVFTTPFTGKDAEEIKKICPMDVFDIEDLGDGIGPRAVTARPRNCTMCRECIRDPEHEQKIKLRRVRDHYIFTVETAGSLKPEVMVRDAILAFKAKAQNLIDAMESKQPMMVPTVVPDDAD